MAEQVRVKHTTGEVQVMAREAWDAVYSQDVDRYGWTLVDEHVPSPHDPVPAEADDAEQTGTRRRKG
jgi:hypothetical protein